ncbi:hypothetical protein Ahy_A02g008995 [Arachis hypogaea]|uniref:Uncharacterized protein n=1 Tax=Arachis hypogaea TaxID=3818 RepID=A0A445EFZ1_ARAHY|nr:hypothetical protein Ahy_A02g008995 [Arachis hypogaea]
MLVVRREKKVGRVGYRMLALMGNRVFRFHLFWLDGDEYVRLMFDVHRRIMVEQVMELSAEVLDVGGGSSGTSNFVPDNAPLAPHPLHCACPVQDMDVEDEESDEEYIADSHGSGSSEDDDDDEFIPETPIGGSVRYLLPFSYLIPELSSIPSHYHTLDYDAMYEETPYLNIEADNYNTDGDVHKFGGPYTCLAPTMSQDHRLILPLIHSNTSVSITVLESTVRQSYHFKPLYRKVWMARQKTIAQIYVVQQGVAVTPSIVELLSRHNAPKRGCRSCSPVTLGKCRLKWPWVIDFHNGCRLQLKRIERASRRCGLHITTEGFGLCG